MAVNAAPTQLKKRKLLGRSMTVGLDPGTIETTEAAHLFEPPRDLPTWRRFSVDQRHSKGGDRVLRVGAWLLVQTP